ncbi:MAG: SusC/RagA family TonB-linked outer membrane protein [Weeksellaceae bacterium]
MRTNIKLFCAAMLLAGTVFTWAQEKNISGQVTDTNGFPVTEAYVYVEGTENGVYTDANGNYSLSVNEGDTVAIEFIGFETKTISVGSQANYDVLLTKGGAIDIGSTVVQGVFGTEKSRDALTSAQKTVGAEELNAAGNANAMEALNGKVSGVQIFQTNSSVTNSNSIQMRGARSITGNNNALIVIDGAISTATVFQQMPAEMIESVNVIKGAQGAALYGSDGVNGVIIVNTKKGSKRGLDINYVGTYDVQEVTKFPERQSNYGQGWDGERYNYENGAWGPAFNGEDVYYGIPLYDLDGNGVIDVYSDNDYEAGILKPYEARDNNIKDFFKLGSVISNDLTLNVGESDKYAMLNLSNVQRDFVVKGDEADRTSAMFKAGIELGKFDIKGSVNYINNTQNTTNSGIYFDLLQSAPDVPIGDYEQYPDKAYAWNAYYNNPYWFIKHNRYTSESHYFNFTSSLGYEITDNIDIKYLGNFQARNGKNLNHRDDWSNVKAPELTAISSFFYRTQYSYQDYYGDLILTSKHALSSDLNLDLMLGHNYQESDYDITQGGGSALFIPGLYTIGNVTKPAPPSSLSNGTYSRNSNAVFLNVDLAYSNYLFLNATARNEWTSVLNKDNNSYFYPSVGVSFVPSKAWDLGETLSYFKVAANWTRVGNTSSVSWYDINSTAYIASGFPYDTSGPTGGALSFQNSTVPVDPNIKPEFVTTKEVNLELGFFKDRISLGASVYRAETDDLITYQSASYASGITRKKANVGDMETSGYEVDLGLKLIDTKTFSWDLNASYANTESKVTKVTDKTDEVSLQSGSMVGIYASKGALFPLIKVNKMLRDDAGRIIIDPSNGNPLYSSDLVDVGTTVPKHVYTLSTAIKFKGFKLSTVMDYRTGHKFFGGVATGMAFNGTLLESGQLDRENGGFVMPNSVYLDSATGQYVENTTIKTGGDDYGSLINYYSNHYNKIGENFLFDASAFKVREISLGYTIGDDVLRSTKIKSIGISVHARNPFIKYADDNLNYADPETSNTTGNGKGVAANNQYPTTRVYGATVNIKF